MIYREFQNLKLSALGLGCMRLPVLDGNDGAIDEKAAQEMVDYSMANGINYYDTAWGYHNECSELVVGKAMKKYPRDSFYLATKFPGYDVNNFGKTKEIFERQLEKCQVDHFDFYLFHNVCEKNIEQYLDDEKYGTYTYLMSQKKNGRIRHLGFSAHGAMPVLKAFLEKYGKDMEFCQLQLNYLDWSFQDAKAKVELLEQYGIPVWVMEPVRGGKLAALPAKQMETLKALRPEETAASWAFRFLQTLPQVKMVLSGMSSMQQLKENIETFSEDKPLNETEWKALMQVADDLLSGQTVPCTACHYCVSHCPQQLDIPQLLSMYNSMLFTGDNDFISRMYVSTIPAEKRPDACLVCHSCEQVCPQQIHIPDALADFAGRLGK